MSEPSLPYAIIIPACNEEECIVPVLAELRAVLDPARFIIAVGVNASKDRTAVLARDAGALVAETDARGYGHGCQAAIDLLDREGVAVRGYIFVAADGANDPADIPQLVAEHERGAPMVLGCRTKTRANWNGMNFHYVLANRAFGALCWLLTGRWFADLGPLRLIECRLFHALGLREWTYGWTIEAQIRAVLLGSRTAEVNVRERPRLAGEQKVSHVSWRRTLRIGLKIVAAGVRTRLDASREVIPVLIDQPEAQLSASRPAAQ